MNCKNRLCESYNDLYSNCCSLYDDISGCDKDKTGKPQRKTQPDRTERIVREKEALEKLRKVQEQKLKERRNKGDWSDTVLVDLLSDLINEVKELNWEILTFNTTSKKKEAIRREAADVANYCAFIVDNLDKPEFEFKPNEN